MHDVPHGARLTGADEVRPAGAGGPGCDPVQRTQVCCDGVLDVRRVDHGPAASDEAQPAAAGPLQDAGDQLGVAGPPHQVRAQRDRAEPVVGRREHEALRDGLGPGVGVAGVRCVRQALVTARDVTAVVHDARGAGVDEPVDPERAAGRHDLEGGVDVAALVVRRGAPDAGLGRDVHDRVAALRGGEGDPGVGEVPAQRADPRGAQRGVVAAGHADDVVTPGEQAAHDGAAQEAATTGDQHPHGWPDAHTPSCGRSILELCRMSTGNDGG